MNRNELIEALVASTQLPGSDVRVCLEALFGSRESAGVIAETLLEGDKVQFAGFGTFETRRRPARNGHNPRTGERIRIGASVTAAFRPATTLRQRLQPAPESRQPEAPEVAQTPVERGNS